MEEKGLEGVRRISRGEGEKSDLIESLPRITQSRKLKPTIQISCEPKFNRAQARLSLGIQLWGRTHPIRHNPMPIINGIFNK